jgi:hypothetical protein
VNWLRTFAVLAVVAVWLPASSHALLQHTGLIHTDADVHHHHDDDTHDHGPADAKDHDAADGICRVESATAKAPCPAFSLLFVIPEPSLVFAAFESHIRHEHSGPSPPDVAPPGSSQPRAPPVA